MYVHTSSKGSVKETLLAMWTNWCLLNPSPSPSSTYTSWSSRRIRLVAMQRPTQWGDIGGVGPPLGKLDGMPIKESGGLESVIENGGWLTKGLTLKKEENIRNIFNKNI